MSVPSEIQGIFQSDIVIRTAIMAAIDDIRANPWLLDHVFASLPKDNLTKNEYGQVEIDAAKKWFTSTRIPVFMSTRVDDATFPCVSISLVESSEAETTLGDVHYVPEQDDDRLWPALTPSFSPESWDYATGIMVVPDEIAKQLVLAPGMQVVGMDGVAHEILDVKDSVTVVLEPGTHLLDTVVVKGRPPAQIASVESVRMKEVYSIGCHVQGEQTHLTYLHSLLVFVLYRYKASLLEARGFERTVVSSSDFRRNPEFENELTFSRHINLTGYVTQIWPADINPKITSTTPQIAVQDAGTLPNDTNPNDSLWFGDGDSLMTGFLIKQLKTVDTTPTNPAPAETVPDLFAYWNMEDAANPFQFNDASTGGNTLAASGSFPALAAGKKGTYARQFMPLQDQSYTLQGAASAPISDAQKEVFRSGDYSVACWFKPNHQFGQEFQLILAVGGPIISGPNNLFALWYDDQFQQFQAGWGGGGTNEAGTLSDGVWTHLAITYNVDDQMFRIYQDGTKIYEEGNWAPPANFDVDASPAYWQLGGAPLDTSGVRGGYAVAGQLDDVRVYAHMLSDAEVTALAQ